MRCLRMFLLLTFLVGGFSEGDIKQPALLLVTLQFSLWVHLVTDRHATSSQHFFCTYLGASKLTALLESMPFTNQLQTHQCVAACASQ